MVSPSGSDGKRETCYGFLFGESWSLASPSKDNVANLDTSGNDLSADPTSSPFGRGNTAAAAGGPE